ncbi:MAG: S9 family peptidase [bacterium]|nr:S9 family peptidase [bacterium]
MAATRLMKSADLLGFQLVSDAQISPDGRAVLFAVSQADFDKKKDGYHSHIWKVEAGRGRPTQFTRSRASESNPRWSPDGSFICFVSGRDAEESSNSGQLWIIPATGGEARPLTSRKDGAGNPRWSPDGKHILFSGRVPLEMDKKSASGKSDPVHTDRLSYRFNGQGFIHKHRNHLFVISSKGGKARQLTSGDWEPGPAAWSADGRSIFFVGNREEDPDRTPARNLYRITSRGGVIQKLSGLPGPIGTPAPSPDGRQIAFAGSDFSRSYGTNTRLYSIPTTGGVPTCLTANLDLSIEQTLNSDARGASPGFGPAWSPDSQSIKFVATERGANRLFALDVKSGDLTAYTDTDRTIESVSYSEDHRVAAYTEMTPIRLAEVFLWQAGEKIKQLTRFNTSRMGRYALSTPEAFQFTASDGARVAGWIMFPPRSRKRRYPGLLQIHGGPRTTYGLGFMHEFQCLAAKGLAVFYINPRGSASYGEDWACAVAGHYGERDYDDLMEATDFVIKEYPIDKNRLGVTGGSYGGFMTNWIVGHSQRFRAACTQRSISNWISFFGTSDIGWRFGPEEIGGMPWDDVEAYWKRSPLAYIRHVKTPTLIIHSEEDWRCPIEQAEQFFVGLKMIGVETQFIRFPGENHELSRSGAPKHRLQRLNHILGWFGRHLSPGKTSVSRA